MHALSIAGWWYSKGREKHGVWNWKDLDSNPDFTVYHLCDHSESSWKRATVMLPNKVSTRIKEER